MNESLDTSDLRDGLIAGAVAGVVSGLPSTIHAVTTGRPALQATEAAGAMVAPGARLLAAVPVHAALSLGWGVLLSRVLPRRAGLLWGAAAGAGIAALDLGIVGRRWKEIRALPLLPQIADHITYGAVVGVVLERRARAKRKTNNPAPATATRAMRT